MEDAELAVSAVEEVGTDAVAIRLESPEEFDARPGQFVKFTVDVADADGPDADADGDETVSRFYTISSPDVEASFEVTVEIDPEGEVGPVLADLAAGDTLTVSGPFGSSYYEDEVSVLVIAGGPGVGPAVGIAERALEDGGEAAVVYRDAEPIHEDRLADIADRGADVRVLAPGEDLSAAVAETLSADTQVFVYGFAEFLDAATSAIADAGGEPDAAKVENFG